MSKDHDNVFVVEDDVSVRISLARLFASANLPNKMFVSAEDFLSNVARGESGFAIIDVHLPGISGLELQKILVQQYPRLSVVIVSAFENVHAEQFALSLGALAFLRKPFDPNALLEMLTTPRPSGV